MPFDPSRLYSALLNTGLQQKDNPLYQVIHQLIGLLSGQITTTGGFSGGGGGGTTNNFFTNITQQIIAQLSENDGYCSSENDFWPPGLSSVSGNSSSDAFIPYFIASGETFTVPANKQGLFAMNIDNEGTLVLDGFLIEVD